MESWYLVLSLVIHHSSVPSPLCRGMSGGVPDTHSTQTSTLSLSGGGDFFFFSSLFLSALGHVTFQLPPFVSELPLTSLRFLFSRQSPVHLDRLDLQTEGRRTMFVVIQREVELAIDSERPPPSIKPSSQLSKRVQTTEERTTDYLLETAIYNRQ